MKKKTWLEKFQSLSENRKTRKTTNSFVKRERKAAKAKVVKKLTSTFKETKRKLTKHAIVYEHYKQRPKNAPVLNRENFKKMLKINIEKAINTGDFASAKKYIPVYKKALAGKLSLKKQKGYERLGYVGIYAVGSGDLRGYTIRKVYNRSRLSKIIPNDILDSKMFKSLNKDLGYSERAINILKGRLSHAKINHFGRPNLNQTLKRKAIKSGSWSGSAEFDSIIEYMGGFLIAITKYPKEVNDLAARYGVPVDDLILKYAPEFVE